MTAMALHKWYVKAEVPQALNAKLNVARRELRALNETKELCYLNKKPAMAKVLNQEILKKLADLQAVEEEIAKVIFKELA